MEDLVSVSPLVSENELVIVYEIKGVKNANVSWNGNCLEFNDSRTCLHKSAAFSATALAVLRNKENPSINVTKEMVRVKFRTSEKINVNGVFD